MAPITAAMHGLKDTSAPNPQVAAGAAQAARSFFVAESSGGAIRHVATSSLDVRKDNGSDASPAASAVMAFGHLSHHHRTLATEVARAPCGLSRRHSLPHLSNETKTAHLERRCWPSASASEVELQRARARSIADVSAMLMASVHLVTPMTSLSAVEGVHPTFVSAQRVTVSLHYARLVRAEDNAKTSFAGKLVQSM